MLGAFGQLRKRNPNRYLTLTNSKTNLNPNPNPYARALRDWSSIVQFVKCCANGKLISGTVRLVKRAIDQR